MSAGSLLRWASIFGRRVGERTVVAEEWPLCSFAHRAIATVVARTEQAARRLRSEEDRMAAFSRPVSGRPAKDRSSAVSHTEIAHGHCQPQRERQMVTRRNKPFEDAAVPLQSKLGNLLPRTSRHGARGQHHLSGSSATRLTVPAILQVAPALVGSAIEALVGGIDSITVCTFAAALRLAANFSPRFFAEVRRGATHALGAHVGGNGFCASLTCSITARIPEYFIRSLGGRGQDEEEGEQDSEVGAREHAWLVGNQGGPSGSVLWSTGKMQVTAGGAQIVSFKGQGLDRGRGL
ncbi:hypothetical protein BDZ90DRAFT_125893 [Jaminaea rosea]|uniref:Uncharacterized protein n=1 Tax=Jaminaea rosea TaxID=1569628 RepID=A0A316UHY8_9BASI|nr:hypothetical protein BDZ90DRAFT_125893 [Jaminaea rosea]PWN24498.1 hypothetical protein BDZ90DRAFT_125893 [Jaminaea rosea]